MEIIWLIMFVVLVVQSGAVAICFVRLDRAEKELRFLDDWMMALAEQQRPGPTLERNEETGRLHIVPPEMTRKP